MSERAGKLMKGAMEALGMVRLKEVEAAQLEIVTLAKTLADRGEIKIAEQANNEEEMVE